MKIAFLAAALFTFAACKKAPPAVAQLRVTSPQTGIEFTLVGFEPNEEVVKGAPGEGKAPALTPTGAPGTYQADIRWATSGPLATHPDGVLIGLNRIRAQADDCLAAFIKQFEPAGFEFMGSPEPVDSGGIKGTLVKSKVTVTRANVVGPLVALNLIFPHEGTCYRFEAVTAELAYDKNRSLMETAVAAVKVLAAPP